MFKNREQQGKITEKQIPDLVKEWWTQTGRMSQECRNGGRNPILRAIGYPAGEAQKLNIQHNTWRSLGRKRQKKLIHKIKKYPNVWPKLIM